VDRSSQEDLVFRLYIEARDPVMGEKAMPAFKTDHANGLQVYVLAPFGLRGCKAMNRRPGGQRGKMRIYLARLPTSNVAGCDE
jgi:hypothetical protein